MNRNRHCNGVGFAVGARLEMGIETGMDKGIKRLEMGLTHRYRPKICLGYVSLVAGASTAPYDVYR